MMQEILEFHVPYAMSHCYNVRISTLRIYLRRLQCVGVGGVGVCSCSGYLFLR